MQQFLVIGISLALLALGGATGCLRIKSDPVEIKPIHITVDVNLRVEKELDNIFDQIDAQDPSMRQENEGKGE